MDPLHGGVPGGAAWWVHAADGMGEGEQAIAAMDRGSCLGDGGGGGGEGQAVMDHKVFLTGGLLHGLENEAQGFMGRFGQRDLIGRGHARGYFI